MKKREKMWVELPEDIISLIITISELDLKSITKCMIVCKQWRNLISIFISNNPLVAKGHDQFLVHDYRLNRFGALDDETHEIAWMKNLQLTWRIKFGQAIAPEIERVSSTCNGLVCFQLRSVDDVYICNPMIGEYVFFPCSKNRSRVSYPQYDLGFCSSSNEYKLTMFAKHTLEVYTLGSPAGWRSVPFDLSELRISTPLKTPICVFSAPKDRISCAICVGGVFHWLLKAESILTFDLAKEVFGSIPLPRLEDGKKIYQLECMNDCLVVTAGSNPPSGLEIWVRKKDKSSSGPVWIKNWVIDAVEFRTRFDRRDITKLMPQQLSSDGRIIMAYNYVYLCTYTLRDKLFRHHNNWCSPLQGHYTSTLVSPKKFMQKYGQEGSKSKKREKETG